jgi:hypothetical protein
MRSREQSNEGQEVSGMKKAVEPNDVRHHSDAPAEGETEGWVSHDTGLHSQDPAEGPDTDDAPA